MRKYPEMAAEAVEVGVDAELFDPPAWRALAARSFSAAAMALVVPVGVAEDAPIELRSEDCLVP